MKHLLNAVWRDDEGQDLVEYALLIVLVGIAVAAAMPVLANGISSVYTRIVNELAA